MANRATNSCSVEGLDALQGRLNQLEAWVYKPVLTNALKAAANLVAQSARGLVPEKTGALKRAIRVRMGRARAKGSISVLATVGRKFFEGPTFYGGFQEFGWHSGARRGDPSKVAKRIARKLQGESRAARDGKGGGLAQKGTAFRSRQEAYFAREGARQAAGTNGRKKNAGEHFMEYAFEDQKQAAMDLILKTLKEGLEVEGK